MADEFRRFIHAVILDCVEGQPEMRCLDCGELAKWPFDFCAGCLEARFGKDEERNG